MVEEIIREVREGGDRALIELEERFDGVKLDSVVEDRVDELASRVPRELRDAIDHIYEQLVEFHSSIKPRTSPAVQGELSMGLFGGRSGGWVYTFRVVGGPTHQHC